jgi:small subunit ribosomal protein S16
MAVKIRLRQQGRKNRQTFRLVVTDIRNPRDGKYIEALGSYDPHSAKKNLQINTERLNYWLSKGAELSPSAERLVKGVAPEAITSLKTQKSAARVKQAAQRRRLKKAPKKAAPAAAAKKPVKKEAAPAVEAEAPKKRRTTAKKTKAADES